MRIQQMQITIPSTTGDRVMIEAEMNEDQLENYRRMVASNLELYGFAGAMVSFVYHNSPGEIIPVDPEQPALPVVPEMVPEPEPVELDQYRKRKSIMDFFKQR